MVSHSGLAGSRRGIVAVETTRVGVAVDAGSNMPAKERMQGQKRNAEA